MEPAKGKAEKPEQFSGDNLKGAALKVQVMNLLPAGYSKMTEDQVVSYIDRLKPWFLSTYNCEMPAELEEGLRAYGLPHLKIKLPGGTLWDATDDAVGSRRKVENPEQYRQMYFAGDNLKGEKLKELTMQFIPAEYKTLDKERIEAYIKSLEPYFTETLGFEIPAELVLAIREYCMPHLKTRPE